MPGIVLCMLSKSAVQVLSSIYENGPVSPRIISEITRLPIRTVFYAISNLLDEDLVRWKPSLIDMRYKMYSINEKRIQQLRSIIAPLLVHDLFQIDNELLGILGFQEMVADANVSTL